MKILHRYVLKELVESLIVGFLFFNFILLITLIFDLTELLFIENAPPLEVGKLVLFRLPSFFDLVIPVSILFAILLAFGRLSSHGEITALRSGGVSLFQIAKPVLLLAVSLSFLALYASAYLTPWCNLQYKRTYREIILQRPTLQVKEEIITDFQNRKLYTYRLDPETHEMEEVILYEFLPEGDHLFPRITLAQKGLFQEDILRLEEASFYQLGDNYRISQQGKFSSQILYLKAYLPEKVTESKTTEEMNLAELREVLEKERMSPSPTEKRIKRLEVDFHGRVAIPIATFLLSLIAVPLGIRIERGEKSISLGISLVIVVVYYVLFLAGKFMGQQGLLPVYLAMWFPNMLIGAAGVWLNLRAVLI